MAFAKKDKTAQGTEVVGVASSPRELILKPKKCGLTGASKPIALIMHSPYDKAGGATKYSSTVTQLDGAGFGLLNKTSCTWDLVPSAKNLSALIKPGPITGKTVTLWLEAHGSLGWFFGEEGSLENELQKTVDFVAFIRALKSVAGITVNNIVLNGCFTANEYIWSEEKTYVCSPARILSLLLPEVSVVGFIGKNASAKIVGLFTKVKDDYYNAVTVALEDAAVLYSAGRVISRDSRVLFCDHHYTPRFVLDGCGVELEDEDRDTTYYAPCSALEELETKKSLANLTKVINYGNQQLSLVRIALAAPVLDPIPGVVVDGPGEGKAVDEAGEGKAVVKNVAN